MKGGRWGRIKVESGVWDWNIHINIYKIINKDLLYSTGNSAQCYVAAWMGGGFRGEWMHVHVWLNPFAVHLKLSQHCLVLLLSHFSRV